MEFPKSKMKYCQSLDNMIQNQTRINRVTNQKNQWALGWTLWRRTRINIVIQRQEIILIILELIKVVSKEKHMTMSWRMGTHPLVQWVHLPKTLKDPENRELLLTSVENLTLIAIAVLSSLWGRAHRVLTGPQVTQHWRIGDTQALLRELRTKNQTDRSSRK